MTASALGMLVDRGLMDWTTPVHDILPEMSKSTWHYASKLTVVEILSHRTGVSWADALYLQSNNNILLPKDESIRTFDYLPVVASPRSTFMYNNHAYNIAGLVIEKVSGQNWGDFVKKNLFAPLGMLQSFTRQPHDPNVALPYNILSDGTPYRIPFCNASDSTNMFAGQSVWTSLGDLLRYSTAYLQAMSALPDCANINHNSDRKEQNNFFSPGFLDFFQKCAGSRKQTSAEVTEKDPETNPLKQMSTVLRPHVSRPVDGISEQTYALGWNRTQLPGSLDFGWNKKMIEPFPLLGERYPGRLVIWHGGNMPGTTVALCLLPRSGTAVVVLQNSLGLCDVADWTCQAILDTIFAGNPMQDYKDLVARCVEKGKMRMKEVEVQLEKGRVQGTRPRPLRCYTDRYYNKIRNWVIEIDLADAGLILKFQGREDEKYELRHYHHDTSVWNLSYDETVKRAQYCRQYQYYMMVFEASNGPDEKAPRGSIDHLRWHHDVAVPEGECFYKSDSDSL